MRRHNILLLWKEANLCARPRVAVGGKLWQCGLGCPCWRASCWGHSHLCDSGVLLLEILIQAPGGTLPSILNLVFFRAPGRDFPGGSDNQNLPTMQETGVQPVGQEDPRGEGNDCIHSSTLAWRILWTEEPGRLQYRVGHDWATNTLPDPTERMGGSAPLTASSGKIKILSMNPLEGSKLVL